MRGWQCWVRLLHRAVLFLLYVLLIETRGLCCLCLGFVCAGSVWGAVCVCVCLEVLGSVIVCAAEDGSML